MALAQGKVIHAEQLLSRRRLRAQPRVVKPKMSNYKAKTSQHRNWPQPTRQPTDAVEIQPP